MLYTDTCVEFNNLIQITAMPNLYLIYRFLKIQIKHGVYDIFYPYIFMRIYRMSISIYSPNNHHPYYDSLLLLLFINSYVYIFSLSILYIE